MNKASSEEKINNIDESTMVLSNGWAAHINTNRISFDDGLYGLSPNGFITNIDPFQSITEMIIEIGGGGIYPWKWFRETGRAIPFPSKARICSRMNSATSRVSLVNLRSSLGSILTSEFKYIASFQIHLSSVKLKTFILICANHIEAN